MVTKLVEYMKDRGSKLIDEYTKLEFNSGYEYNGENVIPLIHTTDGNDTIIEVKFSIIGCRVIKVMMDKKGNSSMVYHQFNSVDEVDEFFTDLDYDKLMNIFEE